LDKSPMILRTGTELGAPGGSARICDPCKPRILDQVDHLDSITVVDALCRSSWVGECGDRSKSHRNIQVQHVRVACRRLLWHSLGTALTVRSAPQRVVSPRPLVRHGQLVDEFSDATTGLPTEIVRRRVPVRSSLVSEASVDKRGFMPVVASRCGQDERGHDQRNVVHLESL
jgi:hypothetical protein